MSDKAPDAFRTISEAADDLDLPQHVLRFWETRFTQIKPLKRGGGRRYYRPDDVEFLRGLKHLLHQEKYTIKGVQKIIKEQGAKAVQQAWKGEGAELPARAASVVSARPVIAPVVSVARKEPAKVAAIAPLPKVSDARSALQAAMAELEHARRGLAAALA